MNCQKYRFPIALHEKELNKVYFKRDSVESLFCLIIQKLKVEKNFLLSDILINPTFLIVSHSSKYHLNCNPNHHQPNKNIWEVYIKS